MSETKPDPDGKSEKKKPDYKTIFLTALLTSALSLGGQYVMANKTTSNQSRLAERQQRQKTYGEIRGRALMLTQLYVSLQQAQIDRDVADVQAHFTKEPQAVTRMGELAKRSDDLLVDLGRSKQVLFESIGTAEALFPPTDEFQRRLDAVWNLKAPHYTRMSEAEMNAGPERAHAWRDEQMDKLKQYVDAQVVAPLKGLGEYLRGELQKEPSL